MPQLQILRRYEIRLFEHFLDNLLWVVRSVFVENLFGIHIGPEQLIWILE